MSYRRVTVTIIGALVSLCFALPAWAKDATGLNMRINAGYCDGSGETCVDGTTDTYLLATEGYPTTRDGMTAGWVYQNYSRERFNDGDARLAGMVGTANSDTALAQLRVLLPQAGTYDVTIAMGDHDYAITCQKLVIKDNDSDTLLTVTDASVAAASYVDATGTELTEANWPSQNTKARITFATQNAYVYLGNGNVGCTTDYSNLNHIKFELVTDATATPTQTPTQTPTSTPTPTPPPGCCDVGGSVGCHTPVNDYRTPGNTPCATAAVFSESSACLPNP